MRDIPEMDVSARAAMLLAAFVGGRSYQPNLLTRGTRDQALITGTATASAYGWGASSHSFLMSVADRLPMSPLPAGVLVDSVAVAAGAAAMAVLPADSPSSARAVGRLLARATVAIGGAGLVAQALEPIRGRRGARTVAIATLVGVSVGSWALTRPGRAEFGSELDDGQFFEDTPREISTLKSAVLGVVAGSALFGLSHLESALASAVSRGAAKVLGGDPDDHRSLGRAGATAVSYGLGWYGVAMATAKLSTVGNSVESVYTERPSMPEVTGSPASGIPWELQSREGTRWLAAVLTPEIIEGVMEEPGKQPIRVYASLDAANSEEQRAELLLRELDRTHALERPYVALFSPTGSGYVNYVACETFEFLTRGDCASACIQYSVLPSALSLTKAEEGTRQTRMVLDGIAERLRDVPADQRPRLLMFGESLGSRVSQDAFVGVSDLGPRGAGIDAAVWVGTPAFTAWRRALWAGRPSGAAPEVGPGALYLPRDVTDWAALPAQDRASVRYLLLQNGDDPIPKFEATLLWRQPAWLGPRKTRPPGAPRGTVWQPITTFVSTFVDLMNALTPTPGRFDEGGHDYRTAIPDAIRQVWRLAATDRQMQRVVAAMMARELGWEAARVWAEAKASSPDSREAALSKAQQQISAWVPGDQTLAVAEIQDIIERTVVGPAADPR